LLYCCQFVNEIHPKREFLFLPILEKEMRELEPALSEKLIAACLIIDPSRNLDKNCLQGLIHS